MDIIIHIRKSGKKETYYKGTCRDCGHDIGYVRKSRINNLCKSCTANHVSIAKRGKPSPNLGKIFSQEIRSKMSLAKKGKSPWNKGIVGVSEETHLKMSLRKKGKVPCNKNSKMTLEQRKKISCTNRDIDINEFDDFTTEADKLERNKFTDSKLPLQCFEKYDFTCDVCKIRGGELNAHHLNSWKHFPEQRFDIVGVVPPGGLLHCGE